ncbi:MAG: hypothetical protein M3N51_12490 [Actinomycetota bacterium]|nr:hypothetical protein [Actinomycetota bacterium]
MSPSSLRILVVGLILAIVVVAAVPLLVLLDLAAGGDGYGVCPDGLASCRISYATGAELAAGLALVLFGLLASLRVVLTLVRRTERRQRLVGGTDRLRQG